MSNVLKQGEEQGKKLVVTGCVPQGDRKNKELQEYSIIGRICPQAQELSLSFVVDTTRAKGLSVLVRCSTNRSCG